jgi:site-specific recombinase XerD
MDRLRAFMRAKHLAYRTEKTYCGWILDFICFHQRKHPETMDVSEVDAWLSYLANNRNVSINTQKTALNAIVFLYKQFLNKDLGQIDFSRTNKGRRLPTVFTHDEAMRVLSLMSDIRNIQKLMRHTDVSTTMIYTHVVGVHERGVASPLDRF